MSKPSLERPQSLLARGTSLHQVVTFVLPFQLRSTSTFWCWSELLFANRAELPGMEGSSGACHVACTDVPFIPVSHKAPWLTGVKQITQVEHLILHVPLFFQQLSNLLNSFCPLLVPHNHYRKHRKMQLKQGSFSCRSRIYRNAQHPPTRQKCRRTKLIGTVK